MTVVVPHPVPLEMPPGDPAALEDVVEDVAGTAYRLAVVRTRLTSSAATAPGWRGADASAAAGQIGVVASLAEEMSAGVAAAAHRLRAHHELLASTRRRVAVLQSQQDEDFAAAWGCLSQIADYQFVAMTDGSQAVAVVEELEAGEAARRQEHSRLLEELADDATAAGRALADAGRTIGGTGGSGDGARVVAYLAAELPGWGDAELRRRGSALAQALAGGPVTPEGTAVLARDALACSGSAAFARGLFAGLGVDGVRGLLASLGYNSHGGSSDLARVLAAAFGAAVPNGRAGDPVAEVLTATYVAVDDRFGDSDATAAGLAAVLLTGVTRSQPVAVRTETVAAWARQLLDRERARGLPAGAGAVSLDWDPRALDPVGLAFTVLASADAAEPIAGLLSERAVWDTVLTRFWSDGGEALRAVVRHAAAEPGAAGREAVRSGLEALGAGLTDEGDPADWTVRKEIAAAVATSLGVGVAGHITVATDVLRAAADSRLGEREDDVLRGLAYLTLDREAAMAVESAVLDWVRIESPVLEGRSPADPLPAMAVAGGFYAVQEYGQRLAYAISGFEARASAELAEAWWNCTWGLAADLVLNRFGPAATLVEGYGAILAGSDGTWENGTDHGLRFQREAAARAVLAELGPSHAAAAVGAAAQATAGYDRTAEVLGSAKPPTSPPTDWLEPAVDAAAGLAGEKVAGQAVRGGSNLLREAFSRTP